MPTQNANSGKRSLLKENIAFQILIPVVILIAVVISLSGYLVSKKIESDYRNSAEALINARSEGLIRSLAIVNDLMTLQVETANKSLMNECLHEGVPSVSGQVAVAGITVPKLLFGKEEINNNFQIVDKIKKLAGGTATVFVKSGSDYIRVSTNVLKDDQTRAIGTKLDPAGKAYQAINNGNSFTGVVEILGKPYLTNYTPIKINGETAGIWYTGYPISSLQKLGETIANSKILQNGFFCLMDNKGKIVFSSSHADKTKVEALMKNRDDSNDTWDIRTVDFPEWGYKIGAGIDLLEIQAEAASIRNAALLTTMLILIVLALLSFIGFSSKR